MDKTLTLIITIIELIGKYGYPAALKIIRAWEYDGEEPTIEEILALKAMVPPAESYFEEEKEEPYP